MTRLSLTVYEDSTKATMIADWSSIAQKVTFDTDEHGFGYLSAFIPMTTAEAFRTYDGVPFAHVLLSNGASVAFEGRIEDRRMEPGGLAIGAYGYFRAFFDAPYSAAWSASDLSRWAVVDESLNSNRHPAKYHIDKHNRLYMALRKNEIYANSDDVCHVYLAAPHNGDRTWIEITFTYDVTLPTDWLFRTSVWVDAVPFSGGAADDTITGNGASQTGTKTVTLTTGKDIVSFEMYNATGSAYTNTGETDDWYAKITAIEARTTGSNEVYGSEIAGALITYVRGINATQLGASTALIGAPGIALNDAWYEDAWPGDILKDVAQLGDGTEAWEVGVWEDQILHFRARGSGRDWDVDIGSITLDSTIEDMYNSAYAVYRDDGGRTRRTAVKSDAASIAKYASVVRRGATRRDPRASSAGEYWRDAFLEDHKDIVPRTRIETSEIYTASGAKAELWQVRSGDTLTIRNLPPGSGGVVDNIRSMFIAATSYDLDSDTLTIYPGAELPSLELLVARNAAK